MLNWTKILLCLLCIAFCCVQGISLAEPSSIMREGTWCTDGLVTAIACTPERIFIGGDFSYVGPLTGTGVPYDLAAGKNQEVFPRMNSTVYSSLPDGSGGWYVGTKSLMHILPNGQLDPSWNNIDTQLIWAMQIHGSKLYFAARVYKSYFEEEGRLNSIDLTTGQLTDFSPEFRYGREVFSYISDMAFSEDTLYVSGRFSHVDGYERHGLVAFDLATGLVKEDWNPVALADAQTSPTINTLDCSDGVLYIGGDFSDIEIGGQVSDYIAALDLSTGQGLAWTAGADDVVDDIEVVGETVYAGGSFDTIGGQSRSKIAALDATTGLATAWNPPALGSMAWVGAIAANASTVYVGGSFRIMGEQSFSSLVALSASEALPLNDTPRLSLLYAGGVYTLSLWDTKLYIGGYFSSIGGVHRSRLAAWDPLSGQATDWRADVNPEDPVSSDVDTRGTIADLKVSDSTLYVCGDFTNINGVARDRLAALDTATAELKSWNPGADGRVETLLVTDSTVYAGGDFTSIGGQTRNHIAALNVATGQTTSWSPLADDTVHALCLNETTLFAGGTFTSIGGQTRNGLAALDLDMGQATDWNPAPAYEYGSPVVYALALRDSTLYAGGRFDQIGGQERIGLAALQTSGTGQATQWNPVIDGSVKYLCLDQSAVYIAGSFFNIGDQERFSLGSVDLETALPTGWNPHENISAFAAPPPLGCIAATNSSVYSGSYYSGGYLSMGGMAFAQFGDLAQNHSTWGLYQ